MAEEGTTSTPSAPERASPLPGSWRVIFYLSAATLGCAAGLSSFSHWGEAWFERLGADYSEDWRWAAALAGAIVIPCAAACLNVRTKWVTKALRSMHAATTGGWPWQAVTRWWTPFLAALPIASVWPLLALHNALLLDGPPRAQEETLDWFLTTCRRLAVMYSEQILFPLLAVYGAAGGRAWVAWIGRYLVGGYWCYLLLLLALGLLVGWPTIAQIIEPAPSLLSTAVPTALIIFGIAARVFWLHFTARPAAGPAAPLPSPTEQPRWPMCIIVFLLMFPIVEHCAMLIAQHYLYTVYLHPPVVRADYLLWSRMFITFAAVGLILYRRRLPDLLLGVGSSRISVRSALYSALPYVLGFLPLIILIDPMGVKTFFSQLFEPAIGWSNVLLLIVIAPIGEELIFRGVLYDYWTRSFGPQRACVLTALTFLGMHGAYVRASLFAPATIVYYLIMSLALTLLRVRTGAVLPCIFAHAGINYFASF